MTILRILNLGAGKGSSAVMLLSKDVTIDPLDWCIFADTQEEPEAVYRHLEWLRSLETPPVLVRTAGKLGDHLINGTNSDGNQKKSPGLSGNKHFAAIPAFTAAHHDGRSVLTGCEEGRVKRQCTKEYKVEVVERTIRRDILSLKPRQRFPADVQIEQWFGISCDEKGRAVRIRQRFEAIKWATPRFPLLELGWRRGDCEDYLKRRVPHEVPRSACVFCPYRSASEWDDLRTNDPAGFARAVEIDRGLRTEGSVVNRGLHKSLYLHRKCVPLEMVDIDGEAAKERTRKGPDLFKFYCDEGVCGV